MDEQVDEPQKGPGGPKPPKRSFFWVIFVVIGIIGFFALMALGVFGACLHVVRSAVDEARPALEAQQYLMRNRDISRHLATKAFERIDIKAPRILETKDTTRTYEFELEGDKKTGYATVEVEERDGSWSVVSAELELPDKTKVDIGP